MYIIPWKVNRGRKERSCDCMGIDGDAVEDDGLHGETGAKAEEDAPVHSLTCCGVAILSRTFTHLIQDEEHAGA